MTPWGLCNTKLVNGNLISGGFFYPLRNIAALRMKNFNIIKRIIIIAFSYISFTHVVYAQDITFEAAVDKPQMSFEEVLVLSFVLSGGNIDLNVTPALPDLKEDFDVLQGPARSTNISIINGKQSSSVTFRYFLSPKKTGGLTIGPATLQYNNKMYTTNPITVEVVKGAQPQAPSSPQDQRSQQQETSLPEIYIRTEVDKETAYIGEQITLSCYLYTRINIAGYDFVQQPNFTGFWTEELDIPQHPTLQYQTINGVTYGVALMKKVALFPTSSGDVTIEPMVMTFSVRVQTRSRDPFDQFFNDPFDNFFGRTQEIIRKTQPVTLKILPLPEENRPDSFNGDVGSFTMSVDIDKTQVTQDEPIKLTVKIQGIGNIKTLKEPTITLPESFKRYDPEITENLFALQEPLQGEKIFESVIMLSSAGEFQIDPVQFSYFDPHRKSYQTIRSEPIKLVILPTAQEEELLERHIATKEEIKLLGQDIRFIKTDIPQLEDQGQYLYQTDLFRILCIFPLLAIGIAYGYKRYREKYTRDEKYVRRKQAKKLSKRRFKSNAEMMNRGNSKEFYAAISQTLRQYIGDKLNLPPAGITGEEISKSLKGYGLDEDTAELLKQCLADCDFARFAPVGSSVGEMNAMLQKAETIIDRIESLKIQGAKLEVQGSQKLLLFILLPALLVAPCSLLPAPCFATMSVPQPLEQVFRLGNTLYEEGKYSEALEKYQSVIESGLENGFVYYNFGNALLKERRIGEAILAYERAKRLLPRDEDVAFNLEYARALTLDKMEAWHSGKIASVMIAIRDFFTPNEITIFFLVMYLVFVILIGISILTSRRWRMRFIYSAILPGFLLFVSAILLFSQIFSRTSVDEAILLAPKSEARTGPGEGYSTVFEIHEGAKIRIQREKLDWVEIKLPNKVIGWVMKKDLARIERR